MELSRFLDTYFVSENNLKYIIHDLMIALSHFTFAHPWLLPPSQVIMRVLVKVQ